MKVSKIAKVYATEEVITQMLRQGWSSGGVLETIEGVPANAKLVDVNFEQETRRIVFVFSHPDFATEIGKPTPEIWPVIRAQQSRKKGKAG